MKKTKGRVSKFVTLFTCAFLSSCVGRENRTNAYDELFIPESAVIKVQNPRAMKPYNFPMLELKISYKNRAEDFFSTSAQVLPDDFQIVNPENFDTLETRLVIYPVSRVGRNELGLIYKFDTWDVKQIMSKTCAIIDSYNVSYKGTAIKHRNIEIDIEMTLSDPDNVFRGN